MSGLFGTDGIRGPFGEYPLENDAVVQLGVHLGALISESTPKTSVVLGGDTRDSTPILCQWLAEGLSASGVEVAYAGVVPTPAISQLTRERRAALGIAVSASHNPYPDNGIKLFDGQGYKWSQAAELLLEAKLLNRHPAVPTRPEALEPQPELVQAYRSHLLSSWPQGLSLDSFRIALDTANGAATPIATDLFAELGAGVYTIGDRPNGRNINQGCGSTHLETIAGFTKDVDAHLGVAFDGDADRALFVDQNGEFFDGDAILYAWATTLKTQGHLQPSRVVATSMSNLGLERGLAQQGIELIRCEVGDRAVVETMRREGAVLGGEQSGHLIHLDLAHTGDGLMTALQVVAMLRTQGSGLADLCSGLVSYPQILRNVRVGDKKKLLAIPTVAEVAGNIERELGDRGRLVLRYSGTEPLARIMIEGPEQPRIEEMADSLATAIHNELGDL